MLITKSMPLVGGWQRFGDPVADLNLHVQWWASLSRCRFMNGFGSTPIHVMPVAREVMKVGAGRPEPISRTVPVSSENNFAL